MKREELIKLIQNSQEVIDEIDFLIVGSQSIVGSPDYKNFENSSSYLLQSGEADVICLNHNYNESSVLEGLFGEMSYYHQTHNVYLQVVEKETCVLINNYEYRLNKLEVNDNGKICYIYFLDEDTVFLAKLLANREKDELYLQEMIDLELVDREKIKFLLEKNREYLIHTYEYIDDNVIDNALFKIDYMYKQKPKNEVKRPKP